MNIAEVTGRISVVHDEVGSFRWPKKPSPRPGASAPVPRVSPGPPDKKRFVETRIVARRNARFARKVAKWLRGFPDPEVEWSE